MKITKKWLKEKEVYEDGVECFLEKNLENIDALELISVLIKDNKFKYANWLIPHLLPHREQVQYAVFAAEPVVEIFEKIYKKEKALKNALEAAKNWLENPSKENRQACEVAACAARSVAEAVAAVEAAADAVDATKAAARAACAAAWTACAAAWAPERAAGAAAEATGWAADAAAGTAAADTALLKTINYGIELLKQKTGVKQK